LIIDVFNHFYPKEYMESLPKPLPAMVTFLSSDNPAGGKGKSITDLDYRISQMDKFGIDKQILSLPGPTLDDLPSNVPVEESTLYTGQQTTASQRFQRIRAGVSGE